MKWLKYTLLAVFIYTSVDTVVAQDTPHDAIHFTEHDGLPSNSVYDMVQDPGGRIWLATSKGLVGYDGTSFVPLFNDSLAQVYGHIEFTTLFMNSEDSLWAGTGDAGLFLIQPVSGKVQQFLHDPENPKSISSNHIRSIFTDAYGSIWIGANALNRYVPETGTFESFKPFTDEKELQKHNGFQLLLSTAFQDRADSNYMYVLAARGICHFNVKTLESKYFFANEDLTASRSAIQDRHGIIWIVDWGTGLYRFDPAAKSFRHYQCADAELDPYSCLNASSIANWGEDKLLISTFYTGLFIFDIQEEQFSPFQISCSDSSTVLTPRNLFYDNTGGLWIMTKNDGAFVLPRLFETFGHISIPGKVNHVVPTADGKGYYACTDDGYLYELDDAFKILHTISDQHILNPNEKSLIRLVFDSDQNLWVLGAFDLYRLTPDKQLVRLTWSQWREAMPNFGYYWDMCLDAQDRLWISAQNGGLGELNLRTHTFKQHRKNPDGLKYDYSIGCLYMDDRAHIWGSGEGVFDLDLNSTRFVNYPGYIQAGTKSIRHTFDFTQDSLGFIWLGENLRTLVRIHPDSSVHAPAQLIQPTPPLPYAQIHSLLTDHSGFIWITSGSGLSKINPVDFTAIHYGEGFGLQGSHVMTQDDNGMILIASDRGIIYFDPEELPDQKCAARPVITRFKVFDKNYPLIKVDSTTDMVELKFSQNFFSFEFSAIDLVSFSPKTFTYMLEGVDKEWIDAGTRRYVSYTNIGGGAYQFKVRVQDDTGLWSASTAQVKINIIPPFWKTIWFWTLAGLLVILILYLIYTYRIRQIRKEEKLKTEFHKQLAEVEMNALRAQMNPHFLFNSLNSIKYYVVKKSPEKAAEYLDNFARLIRLILHNSREQRIPLSQELETLTLYIEMERLRFDEQFDFEINIDPSLNTEYIMIPPLLLQPYAENAIWHGLLHRDQKGCLTVRAYQQNGSIFLEIEDNGIGRHKAQLLKSKSAQQQKSMGMQLTKARMDINQVLSNVSTTVNIIDLEDEYGHACGTKVVIKMQHPDILQTSIA